MKKMSLKDQLIIPVYLNEKTVLDMLAIIEDGFSMVSEVSSSNQNSSTTDLKSGGGLSTKAILDKLLKIQIDTNFEKEKAITLPLRQNPRKYIQMFLYFPNFVQNL